jgi:hypothetical protein
MAMFTPQRMRALDALGKPSPGALLKIYNQNTTAPAATFANAALTVAHPFPLVADGAGYFPAVYVADAATYDYRIETPGGVLLEAADDVRSEIALVNGTLPLASGGTGASTAPGARVAIGAASTGDVATLSTGKVARSGDSMTGALLLNGAPLDFKFTGDAFRRFFLDIDGGFARFGRADIANGNIVLPLSWTARSSDGLVDFPAGITISGAVPYVNAPGLRPPLSQYYESPGTAIVLAAATTFAHLLTARPTLIAAEYECITAEHGYSVGDRLFASFTDNQQAGVMTGLCIVPDATNIVVRVAAAAPAVPNKTSGAPVTLSVGNWRYRVRAWV